MDHKQQQVNVLIGVNEAGFRVLRKPQPELIELCE
jgi:hypothetical protein